MIFQQKKAATHRMVAIAHRGWSAKYPENTLLAFEQAIRIGADYIETDVRASKDRILIISHDDLLERRANRKDKTSDLTAHELHQINVGEGQYIPTLEEILQQCKGKIGIHLEIKEPGLCEQIAALVKKYHMENEVIYSSFMHAELLKMRDYLPNAITGLLISAKTYMKTPRKKILDSLMNLVKKFKGTGLHLQQNLVDEDIMTLAHEQGYYVSAWTVDSPLYWEAFEGFHVDGIMTNVIDQLIEFVQIKEKKLP